MSRATSIKKLAEIIASAIMDEPHFNKEKLTVKIKSIITGFRLDLATENYHAIKNPSKTARLMRAYDLQNLRRVYWMDELKKIVGEEKMKEYYKELDAKCAKFNK